MELRERKQPNGHEKNTEDSHSAWRGYQHVSMEPTFGCVLLLYSRGVSTGARMPVMRVTDAMWLLKRSYG